MKVYKFGGASVRDADAVRNVGDILENHVDGEVWVVVSAMGKTTNALEAILEAYRHGFDNKERLVSNLLEFHRDIIDELFPFGENEIWNELDALFGDLGKHLENVGNIPLKQSYAEIVAIGELLSTRIVSAHLEKRGILNAWLDAREVIHTGAEPIEAKVDMDCSRLAILSVRENLLEEGGLNRQGQLVVVTQGFIGGHDGTTTTLGREGSDYTGGILAWSMDAEDLTIWKDVPGMLNADPKYYPQAEVIERLSYKEAIELSYYGASVIHPKTLKPLQNKAIPLHVRSFVEPALSGTFIHTDDRLDTHRTSYIFKQSQVLLSIIPLDFSFIMEENISDIFKLLSSHGLKANLIQNSALSFSICMDDRSEEVDLFRKELTKKFKVLYNQGLSLLTVRHYNDLTLEELIMDREVLVEQRSRQTARFVLRGGFSLSSSSS